MQITDKEIQTLINKILHKMQGTVYNPTHVARDTDGEWYTYASTPFEVSNKVLGMCYTGDDATYLFTSSITHDPCCIPLPPNLRQKEKEL